MGNTQNKNQNKSKNKNQDKKFKCQNPKKTYERLILKLIKILPDEVLTTLSELELNKFTIDLSANYTIYVTLCMRYSDIKLFDGSNIKSNYAVRFISTKRMVSKLSKLIKDTYKTYSYNIISLTPIVKNYYDSSLSDSSNISNISNISDPIEEHTRKN